MDNGKRLRWTDSDLVRSGETPDARALRQYTTDLNALAYWHINREIPVGEGRAGQREGEDEETMRSDINRRVIEIRESIYPDNYQLTSYRGHFALLDHLDKGGKTWDQLVKAIKDGGQFDSVGQLLAKVEQLDQARICRIDGDELVFVDGGAEVPSETNSMSFYEATEYAASEEGFDMISVADWQALVRAMGAELSDTSKSWCKFEAEPGELGEEWAAYVRNGSVINGPNPAKKNTSVPTVGVRRVFRIRLKWGD
jgi:hypothetical protein